MFDATKILGPDLYSQPLDTANRKGAVEPMVTIQDGPTLAADLSANLGESGDAVMSWKRSTIVDGQARSSS